MKKTRKILLLLAIVGTLLVCCMMSASAYYTEGIFQYTTNGSDEATIIDLIDNDISGEVVIPETIGGYTVTAIEGTFVNTAVTSVVIPDTVKTIGSDTFMNSKVEKIDLGNGVTTIYDNAFTYAPELVEINIPASVELIVEPMARECPKLQNITVDSDNEIYVSIDGVLYRRQTYFDENGLGLLQYPTGRTDTHFTLPDNVYCVHTGAFFGAYNLTSLDFPKNLMQIYSEAFAGVLQGDLNITKINYAGNLADWNKIVIEENNDILSQAEINSADLKYYTYTVTDGKATITYVDNAISGEVIIPDTLGGYPVTAIGDWAFYCCYGITSLTIPDSVTTIGDCAFNGCYGITSLTIPDSVTTIGNRAFSSSGLTDLIISSGVTYIGDDVFSGCYELKSIVVSEDNASYSSDSNGVLFDKNKTILIKYPTCRTDTSYTIPDGVLTIGYGAFQECSNLASVNIPDSVTVIDSYAFSYCDNLTSVNLPDGLEVIEHKAFSECRKLMNVTIPDSVTIISYHAFYDCDSITSVNIPADVIYLGASDNVNATNKRSPFIECDNLMRIIVDPNNDKYSSDSNGVLFDKNKTTLMQYPAGRPEKSYNIPDSVTAISDESFRNCDNLVSIKIPNNVTYIAEKAFLNCSNLESVVFGSSEAPIATFALLSRTVSASEDVVIGKEAFKNCINLKTVLLSDKVTQIDASAFDGCTGLEKIHFEGSEEEWANITENADLDLEEDVIICIYNGPIEEHTHNYSRVENGDNWNNRCTQKWKEKQHCECGDYKVVEKAAVGHSFTNYKTHKNATCTADAQNIAYCNAGCGASNIKNVAGSKLAHSDNNHDGKCDTCKADTTIGCSCRCHKNDFIWKFLNFFYKLFKMNHYCACGKAHY